MVARTGTPPERAEPNPGTKILSTKSLDDVPPELIGTSEDPVFADGHPVRDDIAALRARIASFEC